MDILKQDEQFLKGAYQKALIPCMLSILGGTINILVDGILVGQRIGTNGLAAINLCLPVYLMLCIVGSFLVSGTAIEAAGAIGKNLMEKGQKLYHTSIFSCLAASILISVIGVLLLQPIVHLLVQEPELEAMVASYAGITLIGALPKIMLYIPFWYLRMDGRNKVVTVMMVIMAGGNIILDILFLYVWNMGVGGAAWASVIATAVACAVGFYFLCDKRSGFRFGLGPILEKEVWLDIAKAGSPSAMNNAFQTLRVLAINFLLLKYGGSLGVAVFSAINCISAFSLCVTDGVPQAASAMQGIYSGERDNDSAKLLIRQQWRHGVIYSAIFAVIIVSCANVISGLYGLGVSLRLPMIILAISLFPSLWNSILSGYYNVSGRVLLSNVIIISRVFIFSVGALFLSLHAGISPWWFLLFGEAATLIVWFIVTGIYHRRQPQCTRFLLMDYTLERNGKVMNFSVQGNVDNICEASSKVSEFCENNEMLPKQVMSISLAIEEIMTLILEVNEGSEVTFDVRAFALQVDLIGIRIRYNGMEFNPLQRTENQTEDEQDSLDLYMGIRLIKNMAEVIMYQRVFGMNTLQILV